jgi:hypothetical protein
MSRPTIQLTRPMLLDPSAVWFSAFGFGWGYGAFALPVGIVREKLGAANETPHQLMLAFELGKQRILRAVTQSALSPCGERVTISSSDL